MREQTHQPHTKYKNCMEYWAFRDMRMKNCVFSVVFLRSAQLYPPEMKATHHTPIKLHSTKLFFFVVFKNC